MAISNTRMMHAIPAKVIVRHAIQKIQIHAQAVERTSYNLRRQVHASAKPRISSIHTLCHIDANYLLAQTGVLLAPLKMCVVLADLISDLLEQTVFAIPLMVSDRSPQQFAVPVYMDVKNARQILMYVRVTHAGLTTSVFLIAPVQLTTDFLKLIIQLKGSQKNASHVQLDLDATLVQVIKIFALGAERSLLMR